MKRGRKSKPTTLKLLSGNPGKRKLNASEAHPSNAMPEPPAWLDTRARKRWATLSVELHRAGLLTVIDGDALALYCSTWSLLQHAEAVLKKSKPTYRSETKNGFIIRSRPEVAIRQQCVETLRRLASEFGMTPAARTGIHVDAQPQDEFEGFVNGNRATTTG